MDRLIVKYNKPENTIFISSYPEKNVRYSQKVCAVGGFTKNTIESLQKLDASKKYIVVTVKIDTKSEVYEENNTLILRILDRNNPLSYIPTLKVLLSFTKIRSVVTEFEFGSFGGIQNASLFLIIPFVLRCIGKKQIFVLHQVIENLNELVGHLGWKKNDMRKIIFNPLLKGFYFCIHLLSNKIIVTEEVFKNRLQNIVGTSSKITTIPHGVDTRIPLINKETARQFLRLPLNKKIILYFGYLSWYKGADLFFKFAKKMANTDIQFIMAGGPSFTNVEKSHYKKYMDGFKKPSKNIHISGFVPEEKIPFYFSAADLVVLPYRTMMSSSGPLSLAFSFEKPLIMSDKMKDYVITSDFSSIQKKLLLKSSDLFFSLSEKGFKEKVLNYKSQLLHTCSSRMKEKRGYENVAKEYYELLNALLINTNKVDTMNDYALRFKLGITKR